MKRNGASPIRPCSNDAYRTLKDPIHRTEYLLKLHGAEIGEEHSGKNRREAEMGASRVPADLLEEVFDLNMQLDEMRMAHKMGEEDPALKQSLAEAKEKFDGLRDAVDQDLRAQWKAWDDGDAAARQVAQERYGGLAGQAALSQQPGARCNGDPGRHRRHHFDGARQINARRPCDLAVRNQWTQA